MPEVRTTARKLFHVVFTICCPVPLGLARLLATTQKHTQVYMDATYQNEFGFVVSQMLAQFHETNTKFPFWAWAGQKQIALHRFKFYLSKNRYTGRSWCIVWSKSLRETKVWILISQILLQNKQIYEAHVVTAQWKTILKLSDFCCKTSTWKKPIKNWGNVSFSDSCHYVSDDFKFDRVFHPKHCAHHCAKIRA